MFAKELVFASCDMLRNKRKNSITASGLGKYTAENTNENNSGGGLVVVLGPAVGQKNKWLWAKGDVRPKNITRYR